MGFWDQCGATAREGSGAMGMTQWTKSIPGRSLLRPVKRAVMRPALTRAVRRRVWERKWRDNDRFGWQNEGMSLELAMAIESGWLQPDMSVLDLGCGSGENAAWLAEQGLQVHAVDFSETAINRARHAFDGRSGLTFDTVDVSAPTALRGQSFDALIDRGCLHCIPTEGLRRIYAANVTAWARPGAPFMLSMLASSPEQAQLRLAETKSLLGNSFTIEGSDTIDVLTRTESKGISGIAIRLRRN